MPGKQKPAKPMDREIDRKIKRTLYEVPLTSKAAPDSGAPSSMRVWALSPDEAKQKVLFEHMAHAVTIGEPVECQPSKKRSPSSKA